jgi:hypothetical protein
MTKIKKKIRSCVIEFEESFSRKIKKIKKKKTLIQVYWTENLHTRFKAFIKCFSTLKTPKEGQIHFSLQCCIFISHIKFSNCKTINKRLYERAATT